MTTNGRTNSHLVCIQIMINVKLRRQSDSWLFDAENTTTASTCLLQSDKCHGTLASFAHRRRSTTNCARSQRRRRQPSHRNWIAFSWPKTALNYILPKCQMSLNLDRRTMMSKRERDFRLLLPPFVIVILILFSSCHCCWTFVLTAILF